MYLIVMMMKMMAMKNLKNKYKIKNNINIKIMIIKNLKQIQGAKINRKIQGKKN